MSEPMDLNELMTAIHDVRYTSYQLGLVVKPLTDRLSDATAYHVEVYRKPEPDADGQWRWRVRSTNGQIVASGEGYKRRADMVRLLGRLFPLLEIREVDG